MNPKLRNMLEQQNCIDAAHEARERRIVRWVDVIAIAIAVALLFATLAFVAHEIFF